MSSKEKDRQNAKENMPIHILVIGKTRVGKSAVINAIAGRKVAREGQDTKDIIRQVTRYNFHVGDVKYVVWEAPGLQDTSEDDSVVITKLKNVLKKECSHINLVIYCTLMNRERFEQSEEDAIRNVTEAFTAEIWKNTVFALTYANRVLPPAGYETDEEEAQWFQSRILEFKKVIEGALVKSGVKASKIAVFPAGYHTASRRMPDVRKFYGITDWFAEMYDKSNERLQNPPFLNYSAPEEIRQASKPTKGLVDNTDMDISGEKDLSLEIEVENTQTRMRINSIPEKPQKPKIPAKPKKFPSAVRLPGQSQQQQQKEESGPIHILVIGKTRVGKSAVINSFAGKKIAREGKNTKDICREVNRYDFTVGNVEYVAWEAPGLQDTSEDDSAVIKKLKDALKRECSYINLVIYCTLMNRERFEQSEEIAIRHITEAFTTEIWESAIFALTYANRVLPPAEYETDEEEAEWFQSRIDEFKRVIRRALVENGVSHNKALEVDITPTGYHTASRDASEFLVTTDWSSILHRQHHKLFHIASITPKRISDVPFKPRRRADTLQKPPMPKKPMKKYFSVILRRTRHQQDEFDQSNERQVQLLRKSISLGGLNPVCKGNESDISSQQSLKQSSLQQETKKLVVVPKPKPKPPQPEVERPSLLFENEELVGRSEGQNQKSNPYEKNNEKLNNRGLPGQNSSQCPPMIKNPQKTDISPRLQKQQKKESGPIHILVIGKTRVGKSALINSIAGKKIAREGQNTKDICRDVNRYDFTVGNVEYVAWEAPGLQDTSEDDSAVIKKLKDALKRECSYINLVIYCTLMNRERFEQSEEIAIRHITEAFTTEIWESAIFALTYANRVLPPAEYETDEEEAEWFHSRIDEFKSVIGRALVESGVSHNKALEVNVTPTGYHTASRDASEFLVTKDWSLALPRQHHKLFHIASVTPKKMIDVPFKPRRSANTLEKPPIPKTTTKIKKSSPAVFRQSQHQQDEFDLSNGRQVQLLGKSISLGGLNAVSKGNESDISSQQSLKQSSLQQETKKPVVALTKPEVKRPSPLFENEELVGKSEEQNQKSNPYEKNNEKLKNRDLQGQNSSHCPPMIKNPQKTDISPRLQKQQKKESGPIHILVIGKTRVGKSALINSIAGKKIAREGQNTKDICRDVNRYDFPVGNVEYVAWEAPGLQDTSEDDSAVIKKLKDALKRECSYINLVIYCTLMNRERFEQSEEIAIRHITEAFTTEIWESAIFALTYANRVLPPAEYETDEEEAEWFHSRIDEFKCVIRRALVESGVSHNKALDVNVTPTGYHTASRQIHEASQFQFTTDWSSILHHQFHKRFHIASVAPKKIIDKSIKPKRRAPIEKPPKPTRAMKESNLDVFSQAKHQQDEFDQSKGKSEEKAMTNKQTQLRGKDISSQQSPNQSHLQQLSKKPVVPPKPNPKPPETNVKKTAFMFKHEELVSNSDNNAGQKQISNPYEKTKNSGLMVQTSKYPPIKESQKPDVPKRNKPDVPLRRKLNKEHEAIHILVIGKTRVGKSAIINAIAGEKTAREGQKTFDITREVGRYDFTVGEVKYVVWESPGLQDITEDDSVVITNLKSALQGECNHLDLVIYCTPMNRERFEQSEVDAIRNLTEAFTSAFWGKAVFALTCANRVLAPDDCETDEEAASWFQSRIREFHEVIKQALVKSGVSPQLLTQLIVSPTGYYRASRWNPNPKEFYGITDWVTEFWQQCEKKIKEIQCLAEYEESYLGKDEENVTEKQQVKRWRKGESHGQVNKELKPLQKGNESGFEMQKYSQYLPLTKEPQKPTLPPRPKSNRPAVPPRPKLYKKGCVVHETMVEVGNPKQRKIHNS